MSSRLIVLCVDDEQVVLTSLRDQLRRHLPDDLEIETAESGEEGLEILEELGEGEDTLALVISDQLMPGMRGEEFLARIHDHDPRVINVLLTGQASADAVGDAVNRAKLYRYVGKPWDERDLVLTVQAGIDSYRQARELERQDAELRESHAASLRFVPSEFLRLLGRERLVDVAYGDHVQRPMHVLFSDMRSYTRMVEGKTATEAFAFVNEYMQRMDATLRAHRGFIGNIEGDAILALFPSRAGDALRAGIECHRALRAWNHERDATGEAPIRMGVGVNSGPLLLGTVGGADRIQCDVVGSPVNLASRIESLTKHYGAQMLASDATLGATDGSFDVRMVDRVIVKGSERPVTLFELLDALDDEVAERRRSTREAFEAAGEACRRGDGPAAQAGYERVLEQDPEDAAAALLRQRAADLACGNLSADWDGVMRMSQK